MLLHQGTGCQGLLRCEPRHSGRPSVTMRLQMCREPQPLALSLGWRGRYASRISRTFRALMPASHPISSLMPVSQDPWAAPSPAVLGRQRRHFVLCARQFFPILKIIYPLNRQFGKQRREVARGHHGRTVATVSHQHSSFPLPYFLRLESVPCSSETCFFSLGASSLL